LYPNGTEEQEGRRVMTRKEYEELQALVKQWNKVDYGRVGQSLADYYSGKEGGYSDAADELQHFLKTVEVEE
jgi:hypothetical protein